MRIGIDISQIVYEGSGVARYVREMVRSLLKIDTTNEYVLFGASLRKQDVLREYFRDIEQINAHIRLVLLPIPITVLEVIWNRFHIIPIETFTGPIDVFWSSDWVQPPLGRARGITTIHDLVIKKFPESFGLTDIVHVQNRRLALAKKECEYFLCDSSATKHDIVELLGIPPEKCATVYPGLS